MAKIIEENGVQTIRYNKRESEEIQRAHALRQFMCDSSLLIHLRGLSLDQVVEMWWRANGYTNE